MGKARKWIIQFLIGKKEKETEKNSGNNQEHSSINNENSIPTLTHTPTPTPTLPIVIPLPTTSKEKRRWSFRRSSATSPSQNGKNSMDSSSTTLTLQHAFLNSENDPKKLAMAAKATASMSQFTVATVSGRTISIEDSAAIKIQSFFRAYLARTALNALRGLVKLQALVRGHLVRRQAISTLRCLQALVTVQDRSRAQRLQMLQDSKLNDPKHFNYRKPTKDNWYRHSNQEFDWGTKQNVKIVEMDTEFKGCTKSRNSYSNHGQIEPRISSTHHAISWHENQQISPTVSARTDMSPKTCSGHFEDYTLGTHFDHEYPFHPNYMANTKSSKAKVRSQSAPKQRQETPERQQTRRNNKQSLDGRNVPRAVKMQRSSSRVGSAPQTSCYPWSVKLDRSNISLKDRECGSNSTVLTDTNYCRSLVGFEVQPRRY